MDLFLLLLLAAALAALFATRGSLTRIRLQPLAVAPDPLLQPMAAARRAGAPVTDPRHAGRGAGTLWELRASPACPLTRAVLDGRRFRTDEAIPLPTLGCRLATCRCHYTRVCSARHGERRRSGAQTSPRAAERRSPWTRRQARGTRADV